MTRPSDDRSGPDAEEATSWSQRLRAVLAERGALLEELESVGAHQETLVEEGRAEELLELLAARQSVVDRFVAGHEELVVLAGSLGEHAAELPAEETASLRLGVRSISEALERLTERDDRTQAMLRKTRESTREELRRTERGGDARTAYTHGHVGPGRPIFADRRG